MLGISDNGDHSIGPGGFLLAIRSNMARAEWMVASIGSILFCRLTNTVSCNVYCETEHRRNLAHSISLSNPRSTRRIDGGSEINDERQQVDLQADEEFLV
jgi:hypothetical protein